MFHLLFAALDHCEPIPAFVAAALAFAGTTDHLSLQPAGEEQATAPVEQAGWLARKASEGSLHGTDCEERMLSTRSRHLMSGHRPHRQPPRLTRIPRPTRKPLDDVR